ncbi:alkaline shock response membrane anchor protein AmaP [Enterococcus saccharolyticus]|uniref:Alkaline shock response membrane anchor protein AmaP n=1 Tax=Candidatus Enterococcus willemsii TaxID=1857215 RepID=A0ABQ6Z248_9ENTE|nr:MULTISPECIES: alkaline shock response membrane anchor protein AmaP [Enterococcus]KAF1305689.1 hypothetical protein BAU17_00110 [Enterococcus sp. CU12B]MCD5001168.1 alkaline shock response membrane anchor protein AmaP [Enterococcus saccharolyticus]
MNKLWKGFLSILLLLVFVIFLFVMIENQAVATLPFSLISMYDYPWIHTIIPYFLFWGSVVSSLLLVIALIWVWAYPSRKNELVLDAKNGTLKIQKRAIENFVLEIVKKEVFIDNPSVRVKIDKKKISVTIFGKMRKVMETPERQRQLIQTVNTELMQLLGTTDNLTTKVVLNDYRSSKKTNEKNRVE